MKKKNIYEKLLEIQIGIKAPKNKTNLFGKYKYRNLESILEEVKPFLEKQRCILLINNELEEFGGKIFRKSIATLRDVEGEDSVSVSNYTLEALEKKGMSPEQCSGSVASYGDKYALNKLFCLDDNQDADSQDNSDSDTQGPSVYRVKFGKHKGQRIDKMSRDDLTNYCKYIKDAAAKDNKELEGDALELINEARKFLTKK